MDEIKKLQCIKIAPPGKHDASVIWLHGLGASADDFLLMVDEFDLPADHGIQFIFPNAPVRPITVNGGMLMPGWYDLESLSLNQHEDEVGIHESQALINRLIEDELKAGVLSQRILLGGFSQGGAMSIFVGTRFTQPLGGLLGLSCYALMADTMAEHVVFASKNTPIFLAHGMFDPVVPYHLGQALEFELKHLGYTVESHTYPMQHTVSIEEIDAIGHFIRSILLD